MGGARGRERRFWWAGCPCQQAKGKAAGLRRVTIREDHIVWFPRFVCVRRMGSLCIFAGRCQRKDMAVTRYVARFIKGAPKSLAFRMQAAGDTGPILRGDG